MSKKKQNKKQVTKQNFETKLRSGDIVMVVAGGNDKKSKKLKGETGKLLKILPKKNRVIVEGVNMIKRHKRATTSQDTAGIIEKEGAVHISNVMFYSEELKRPVRLKFQKLDDGRKVRGFVNPDTKSFEQVDA